MYKLSTEEKEQIKKGWEKTQATTKYLQELNDAHTKTLTAKS